MELNGRWFIDGKTKRTILFKGVNLGGGTKLPNGISSHERDGYWVDYDRNVSFVGRPFPLDEADEHLQRLVNLGFNLLRFIITWEAVEHEGPGIYDEAYLDYVVKLLKKCQEYGLYVYIDPHQDSWSRHCGGSGHPGWTLPLVGLNPLYFPQTNAAIVHNLYPDPAHFPKMIWNTNYQKLAAATLFTLFFAGKTYAPKCIVNGVHVQDYLQQHYYRCFRKVAQTIHDHGLENTCVVGYDTMNEPGHGYLSVPDITQLNQDDTDFKMGLMPTAFEGMLLGSGVPTKVEHWEFKWNGPKKSGNVLVDPAGAVAWLSGPELNDADQLFGWQRDSGWSSGCIWALHQVWDKSTHKVLQPYYFATEPNTETATNYIHHWIDYVQKYTTCLRSVHWDAILFVQPPILAVPPKLPTSLKRIVYSPHWYDGLTLVKKKWCSYNVDFINLNRGKYGTGPLRFLRALRLGEKAIRQCFVDQLHTMQTEGLENIGQYPCILGEIGIPYDMEGSMSSSAFWDWVSSFFVTVSSSSSSSSSTGQISEPNSSQNKAMDASINALEKNLLNYSLWNYMPDNNEQWGDLWNGEDLSIWQNPITKTLSTAAHSTAASSSTTVAAIEMDKTESAEGKQTLISNQFNGRNVLSLHRPHPMLTSGTPLKIDFVSPTENTCASFEYILRHDSACEGPTEIYVPSCHFPCPPSVEITTGRWELKTVNDSYSILLWWIDEESEAKLNLKGICYQ
ncbi:hypothetical protein INT48_008969 [Thamnidium elegans]|uniref:Uncharacterized protein n=1 Tax=Thamnidium elegans TaxID=101142 RepID=A0A8H7SU20_9FUNG|nr:hypothetical protein INT48_008969 [Thamnidium elegans]